MTFTAQYRSDCDACDDPIRPGDEIERNASGEYVHTDCPGDNRPPADTCGRCWTELPASGVCGVCE